MENIDIKIYFIYTSNMEIPNPNDSKLECFVKEHANTDKTNKYVHYDNKYTDFNLYYNKNDKNVCDPTDSRVSAILTNMYDKDETSLTNEELFILKFTQTFHNHEPIFIHPSKRQYHLDLLFNSIIDLELESVETNENAVRTVFPEMRKSFYEFCRKHTNTSKII